MTSKEGQTVETRGRGGATNRKWGHGFGGEKAHPQKHKERNTRRRRPEVSIKQKTKADP
jgi:hypothetical protein